LLQQIRFIAGKEQFRKAPIKTAARLCSWKLHCLASKEAVVRLEGTPLRISLPPQWHGHSKLIYALGWRFDPELPFLASKLPDGAVVFDIGANVGAWSLILSHAVGPRGRIFAYEPTQATYDTLSRNVELNSATNIFPFRYALSDSNSQLRLYHHVDCSRNSLGPFDDTAGYEDAPSRRLDDVAAKLMLDRLDFIKVDVEGAEPLVLNGSLSTLRQFKPASYSK